MEKFEFIQMVEEVDKLIGHGTELVSVYIPEGIQISDVISHLKREYSQSQNIKSKSTMKNVTSAITSIISSVKSFKKPPERGMAVFSGFIDTKMVSYTVFPIESIRTYMYKCDSKFFTDPLKEMLEDKILYGLIVIDTNSAAIAVARGRNYEILYTKESGVMGKHGKGGQSAKRFERLHEISVHVFYKEIGALVDDAFLPIIDKIQGIVVGGAPFTKEEFIEKAPFDYRIREKILQPYYGIGYSDESGIKDLVNAAQEQLLVLDFIKQKKLISRLFREISLTKSLATYGKDHIIKALQDASVDKILISENFQGDIKEIKMLAEKTGASIEYISFSFEEGAQFFNAFGGLAALLRF